MMPKKRKYPRFPSKRDHEQWKMGLHLGHKVGSATRPTERFSKSYGVDPSPRSARDHSKTAARVQRKDPDRMSSGKMLKGNSFASDVKKAGRKVGFRD